MINYQYQRWLKDIRARACSFESWKNDPAQQNKVISKLIWRGFLEAVSLQESWISSNIFFLNVPMQVFLYNYLL
jgi:hypothetical protein